MEYLEFCGGAKSDGSDINFSIVSGEKSVTELHLTLEELINLRDCADTVISIVRDHDESTLEKADRHRDFAKEILTDLCPEIGTGEDPVLFILSAYQNVANMNRSKSEVIKEMKKCLRSMLDFPNIGQYTDEIDKRLGDLADNFWYELNSYEKEIERVLEIEEKAQYG